MSLDVVWIFGEQLLGANLLMMMMDRKLRCYGQNLGYQEPSNQADPGAGGERG